MKSRPAASEDEDGEAKIRSSRGKRRHRSRSPSSSDSPPRKRSKKHTKKNKRSKGSRRRRRRHRTPSSGPSSVSRGHSRHSSSASERSMSPPPRRSRSGDTRKRKRRGREKHRKRTRRSRSCSSTASDGSTRSKGKSREPRAGGARDDASRYETVQDYDDRRAYKTEKNSPDDVARDEDTFALHVVVAKNGTTDVGENENNVRLEKMESPPSEDSKEAGEIVPSEDSNEAGEIIPSEDANEASEIVPSKDANESEAVLLSGNGSPEAEEDLELILRQKALENFKKFRGAAVKPSKGDIGASGKEVLANSPPETVTKIAEARSAVTPSQGQGSSIGVSHSPGSPGLEDIGNDTSPWRHDESNRGDRLPGALLVSDTSAPSQHQGRRLDATRSIYVPPQGRRNGGSVMQRLGSTSGNSSSVKQRLGSGAGVSATPRVRSVVSIPAKEGHDGSTFTTSPRVCDNPAPVASSSEAGHPPIEINKLERTDGGGSKISEAPAPRSSVLSTDDGTNQAGTEDKEGSQFEKRTFSRMHDGETVQVSYKVYIPTKSPRLARKLQR